MRFGQHERCLLDEVPYRADVVGYLLRERQRFRANQDTRCRNVLLNRD
jgi:hypothetical protein